MTKIRPLFRSSLFSALAGTALLLLASTATAAEYVSVIKDGVNIRSGPETTKEILWTVFKGFPLQVTSTQGTWAKVVDFEGDTGWIATSLIAKEKTVIVKSETANLRVGAGKDYEIVAAAKRGVVFKPLTTEGDWIKVKHADGTTGWILGKLLWPN
ncbi:MAG: SH3 domain-containing protein [Proteobacteria bacterium]|nr:SH3 domain-containing protein [Pseudomonadota bacterium]MBU1547788.1 SH3 domain-containing protein [Pseudomonadota bacterium]MBU2618394.1 SH3 domain-containing protein [Pseudomonadota bacterium]